MKNLKLTTALCFSLCATSVPMWAQSPTAPILDFNMMVQNDAQFKSSEMEGPLAIGGDLNINGSYTVNSHNKGTYKVNNVPISMVVNDTVNYISNNSSFQVQNGYVKIRDCGSSVVWYHDPNNATPPIRITKTSNYNSGYRIELQQSAPTLGVSATNNPVEAGTNINFDSIFTVLKATSTSLAQCTDNAVLKTSNGSLLGRTNLPNQVKIYLHSGANVLNISGSEMNGIHDFTFQNQQPDATHFLIVNVDNSGTFNWHVYNSGSFGGTTNCQYILYNFYNTTSLNIIANSAVEGTIFAPYADIIKSNNSNMEGQVIGKSYKQNDGGEIHYAAFLPNYGGCGSPTVSSFTVNDTTSCLNGNSFLFANQSTGDGTLTYFWNFGDNTTDTAKNPVKTYGAPGNYSVVLIANGNGGADTSSQTVTVLPQPQDSIIVDATIMALASNSFHFRPSPDSTLSYTWYFGDNTGTTQTSPIKSYSQAGSYNVMLVTANAGRCTDTSYKTVYVASDSVGTGHDGGLESVSLGGLVGKRDFNKIKYSIPTTVDYAQLPVLGQFQNKPTGQGQQLEDIIPNQLVPGMVLRVTSPEDLLYLTKAKDVFSVDYTLNNQAKAVALGIETLDKAYSHTKSTCDRFRGSVLLNVDSVNIGGFPFERFTLRNQKGMVEYAIAFVVGKTAGQDYYSLQTNWLISKYKEADTFFNMQVWSARPDYTNKLVSEILTRLESYQNVVLRQSSPIPASYVVYGKRVKDNLVVQINNNTDKTSGKLVFQERKNEQDGIDELTVPVQLVKGSNNVFDIPVKDGYEYQGAFYLNDSLTDEVYMADGNWGLDYDKNYTTIEQYTIGNNPNRVYNDDEYSIYRSSDIKVKTTDYFTAYKAVSSGTEPTDLTDYKSLKFVASGTGDVVIRLTKASITDWNAQYQFTLPLRKEPKEYAISLSDFKSETMSAAFIPNDIKTVSFTILDKSGEEKDLNLFVGDMSFSPDSVMSILALRSKELVLSPNPSQGVFKCKFASEDNAQLAFRVTDITGKVILEKTVDAVKGYNIIESSMSTTPGIFIVSLDGKKTKYEAQKLVIKR